jgi:hypothetical protein
VCLSLRGPKDLLKAQASGMKLWLLAVRTAMSREGPPSPTLYVASDGAVPGHHAIVGELAGCGAIRAVDARPSSRGGWYALVTFETASAAQAAKHRLQTRGFYGQRCTALFARSTSMLCFPTPRPEKRPPSLAQESEFLRKLFSLYGEVVRVEVGDRYTYVSFNRTEQAEAAVRALQGKRNEKEEWIWDIDFVPAVPRGLPAPLARRSDSRPPQSRSPARERRTRSRSPLREPVSGAASAPQPAPPPPAPPTADTPPWPIHETPRSRRSPSPPPTPGADGAATGAKVTRSPEPMPAWAVALTARLAALESRPAPILAPVTAAPAAPSVAVAALIAPSAAPFGSEDASASGSTAARSKLAAVLSPLFEPNHLDRSFLCGACREKAAAPTVPEGLVRQLLHAWFDSAFEPSSAGMTRSTMLHTHLNPFLSSAGLRSLDFSHPAWLWFLREVTEMSEDKIKAGRSMIKVQPRPKKTELIASLTAFLKQLTSSP